MGLCSPHLNITYLLVLNPLVIKMTCLILVLSNQSYLESRLSPDSLTPSVIICSLSTLAGCYLTMEAAFPNSTRVGQTETILLSNWSNLTTQ